MRVLSLVLCLVSGCTSLEDLERPSLVRNFEDGLCGSTLALEPNGDLWGEGGCENGATFLSPRGHAAKANADEVRRLFEELRDVKCVEQEKDIRHFEHVTTTYMRFGAAGVERWNPCETVGPEPWTALDAAFNSL